MYLRNVSHNKLYLLVKKQEEPETNVDVPVDEGFFTALLGPHLLKNNNAMLSEVSTVAALSNARLIAFYFSAHWCPPCRQFTPVSKIFFKQDITHIIHAFLQMVAFLF